MDSLPVADRTCGSCMMCCKLPTIESLGKEAGVWCRFAKSGQGCTNYADRPTQCSTFFCGWMREASFGPEWKPSVAKFLFFTSGTGGAFTILPDTGYPNSWRNPVYYPTLKKYACELLETGIPTFVIQGSTVTVILPDRDETILMAKDKKIKVNKIERGNMLNYEVSVR